MTAARLRTDFVARPTRVSEDRLRREWRDAEVESREVVDLEPLTRLKMTRREKDWAVIGELARRMSEPRQQMLYSRSSRDLVRLAREHPELLDDLRAERPLLASVEEGREALEEALDRDGLIVSAVTRSTLARYGAAAAEALGYSQEAFVEALRTAERDRLGVVLDQNPLAVALLAFSEELAAAGGTWEGEPGGLVQGTGPSPGRRAGAAGPVAGERGNDGIGGALPLLPGTEEGKREHRLSGEEISAWAMELIEQRKEDGAGVTSFDRGENISVCEKNAGPDEGSPSANCLTEPIRRLSEHLDLALDSPESQRRTGAP